MTRTAVRPTFRADNLLSIRREGSGSYVGRLGISAGVTIRSYRDFLQAASKRLLDFSQAGCKLMDVGIERFPLDVYKRQAKTRTERRERCLQLPVHPAALRRRFPSSPAKTALFIAATALQR